MPPACNVINNPGFEAGLESWTTSGPATVVTGPVAYAGENFLSLETTADAPTNTVTQDLYWLDTANVHNLTVQVRVEGPIPATSHCEVRAYIGEDADAGEFASDIIFTGDEWVTLQGSFQPTVRDTTITLVGYCAFGESDEEYFNVYFDDVIVADC
ncbi:hypothetical protein ASPCAL02269 [Aspergillus calidoustus]|uniref:CBM-cenC domain-containing protein n=1 Tax=Aspergillus calidoustus TaxID=454130 RepID=A0A0U5CMD3_ASPCI|nr:hypothetical protein ASPCAL02269 [Aspergillus calidoustus]